MSLDTEFAGGPLRPTLRVSYNYDFTDQDRSLTAILAGAPVAFAMPVYQPGRSWADIALGAEVDVSTSFTANIALGSQLGQSDVSNYYVNVGESYKF
ncbi:MAG TPA: autotransporter outer membrane beta-barrel domain-containing protein [Ancylobacter sp.]